VKVNFDYCAQMAFDELKKFHLPGIRFNAGVVPFGLRQGDTIASPIGDVLLTIRTALGFSSIWLDEQDTLMVHSDSTTWKMNSALLLEPNIEIGINEKTPLIGEIRDVCGHRVLGPRRVDIELHDSILTTATHWDVIGRPLQRLTVRVVGGAKPLIAIVEPPAAGLSFSSLQPHAQLDRDASDTTYSAGMWGSIPANIAKRLFMEVEGRYFGSVIDWNGRIRAGPLAARTQLNSATLVEAWWHMVEGSRAGNMISGEVVCSAGLVREWMSVDAASDAEMESFVSLLRPQFVERQRHYRASIQAFATDKR
jgi:hypothetical protein